MSRSHSNSPPSCISSFPCSRSNSSLSHSHHRQLCSPSPNSSHPNTPRQHHHHQHHHPKDLKRAKSKSTIHSVHLPHFYNHQPNKTPLHQLQFDASVYEKGLPKTDAVLENTILTIDCHTNTIKLMFHNKCASIPFRRIIAVDIIHDELNIYMSDISCECIIICFQSIDDLHTAFNILYIKTYDIKVVVYKEYYNDNSEIVLSLCCKKRYSPLWKKRSLHITHGAILIYDNEELLTITPITNSLTLDIKSHTLTVSNELRKYCLKFQTEQEVQQVVEAIKINPQKPVKKFNVHNLTDFSWGNLIELTKSNVDVCIDNKLYPDQCNLFFPQLCQVLKSETGKKYATIKEKSVLLRSRKNVSKSYSPTTSCSNSDWLRFTRKEDPMQNFTKTITIGTGGFGEVLFATRTDHVNVALKVLRKLENEDGRMMFADELCKLKCWRHPNLVGFEGSWEWNNKIYVAMEYCSRGTLALVLKNRGKPFHCREIAYIVREVLRGLSYIHEKGFMHRDIKPQNVMFTEEWNIKIIDFGLTCPVEPMQTLRAGSKMYMAPEVIMQIPYNEKADIWSVGCIMQELLEMKVHYREYSLVKALFMICSVGASGLRNSTTSEHLPLIKEVIKSTLSLNPTNRPPAEQLLSHSFFSLARKSKLCN
ncbi:Serine/threonine protein kinase [Entamoeba marina]